MSSLDRATRSLDPPEPERGEQPEAQAEGVVANDNANDCIEIWPEGDPHVFARTLARVLVRHALQKTRSNAEGLLDASSIAS